MIKTIYKYLKESNNILIILLSALIFRLFIANFGTVHLDQGTFVAWAADLSSNGFKNFYLGWSDYFPGYLYVLWVLGKINQLLPGFEVLIFKLPAIIADLLTGFLIYKIVTNVKGKGYGLISSLLYLFNPAIFSNSSLWGQVDSLTALLSLMSLYLFPFNIYFSAISLALGTLVKPQAAFILPAFLYMFIVYKRKIKDYFVFSLVGMITFILGFLPFNNQQNFFQFVISRFDASANQYPYGSVNAFSFWGLFGFWKPDEISFWIGLGVSVLLLLFVTITLLVKRPKAGEYLLAGLSFLITFMFLTRMHERHLLPSLAPLLVYAALNPVLYIVYSILSLTYVANLSYAYYWIVNEFKEIFNPTLIKIFIVTNLTVLVLALVSIFKKMNINFNIKFNQASLNEVHFTKSDVSKKFAGLVLLLILTFSFLTRIYALDQPNEMYFDEIYHSFTARLVLNNDPKAWEWWNPHPEGYAYEWTHPPLSKLSMALGMKILGDNPLGWRVPQAIFGTLAIYLIYLLASVIFKDRLVGLLAAALLSLEGLTLVLSRMGMNDSYVLFFSLLSVLLFIKDRNILSAIAFGLAIASKWSSIYTLPIIFISHFVFRKKIKLSYLAFLVLPILVYVASYGIMFQTGHSWDQFVEVQKQMWWYHTNLDAEHPYTSPAWAWPLLLRPIYLYDGQIVDGLIAKIYAFGNPSIFWFGLFSIILSIFISAREKNKKLGFVVFSYLIFFLPWIASPRIMFLYHYLPSVPYLAIASGFILRRFPRISIYVFILSFGLFVYFYPHWIGMRIPLWLDESYYWFDSWR